MILMLSCWLQLLLSLVLGLPATKQSKRALQNISTFNQVVLWYIWVHDKQDVFHKQA